MRGWARAFRVALRATLVLALPVYPAEPIACGPDFPNQLLRAPEEAVLSAPAASFRDEIAKLAGKLGREPSLVGVPMKILVTGDADKTTTEADLADLDAALKGQGVAETERIARVTELAVVRAAISERRFPDALPATLPAEFRIYLEGAVAFWRWNMDAAIAKWKQVLTLPAGQRRYRTTWAAFMLGKAYHHKRQLAEAIMIF